MQMIYLAHPVRPLPGSSETVESNLRDAEWWLCSLQRANPDVSFAAQWILDIRLGIGDESNHEHRRIGLERCRAIAKRCTGIAICGPRISSGSFSELSATGTEVSPPVVHRFSRRDQDLALPHSRSMHRVDFPENRWLKQCIIGAVPYSIDIAVDEILFAIIRERAVSR